MEWLFQYKVKGDTTIHKETIDLNIKKKKEVIKWWKENKNSKKDLELVNCSDNGDLNIIHSPLIGKDLELKNSKNIKK